MSLILEALNRAEQERKHQQQVPDIHTQHQPPQAGRPWRPWVLAGALAAVLILAAGWYLMASRQAPEAGQPLGGQAVPLALVPEPKPASTPAGVQAENPAAAIAAVEDTPAAPAPSPAQASAPAGSAAEVQQLYAPPAAEPIVEPAQVAQLYQPEPAQPTRELTWPEAGTQEESGAVSEVAAPEPTASVGSTLAPRPELPARYLSSIADVPYFNDLPWLQKQQIPTISYSRHNYLANGISSVVINGETRGIGNLVSSGQFIVEDILADGVVLRYEHRRFKLPALTGWVNM